ncbi:3(or 17)beta-hydroxysteroid dehydrogenase [Collimonas sp. OK607]|uniref:SDR family oxidoreductase n=1 Tax=Collimonas sp. OK607 TaxID=1798194 RepID=UPI0008F12F5B|nr:SDR family oxidoreductase [Collimonas sp. OK607]SFB01202.1 3(or 17)beta-hydroxysteroid dehydrogenase [Collimonas sp. OK607]
MKVSNKVAFLTGGTGGLGAEAARALIREGAKVIITDVNEEAGTALARQIGATFYKHDVTDLNQWQELVARAISEHGRIDILVQFAGIEGDITKDVFHTEPSMWNKVIAINLTGTFYGCRTVVPHMMERGTGSVINISSIVSFMTTAGPAAYGASKAGVQHLTTSVAVAASKGGNRVRVNSVHPGVIKTRMTDNIIAQMAQNLGVDEAAAEAQLMSGCPFQKRGMPVDVANLVLFLASDDSEYVTGSAFQVDGGWHLKDTGA